ncbi:MAG: NTP transferase domain-containing protein [Rhodobacteraceae bacterium]|nr:NTP transferase domain-containing protein [Paracoccaceae bacterium]
MGNVLILIPAAGAAARMRGPDKLALCVGGQPMLTHAAAIATQTGRAVLVTLRAGDSARRALLAGQSVSIAELADAGEGMSASLREGARQATAHGAAALMVVPADLPWLTLADLQAALAAWAERPGEALRGTAQNGTPGHPVMLPAGVFAQLLALSGDIGARSVLARVGARLLPLPGRHAVADIDTPEDYAAALQGPVAPK